LASALHFQGFHDRALSEVRRVLEFQQDLWVPYAVLGAIYSVQGKTAEAIATHEKGVQVAPWNAPAIGMLSGMHARAGDYAAAEKALAPAQASPQPLFRALAYGVFYALGSEFERAADEFEKAVEARHPFMNQFAVSPVFADFLKHPRGRALLAKMNLADVSASGA
jgi:tetratricopeptide (TPR) repeat protein